MVKGLKKPSRARRIPYSQSQADRDHQALVNAAKEQERAKKMMRETVKFPNKKALQEVYAADRFFALALVSLDVTTDIGNRIMWALPWVFTEEKLQVISFEQIDNEVTLDQGERPWDQIIIDLGVPCLMFVSEQYCEAGDALRPKSWKTEFSKGDKIEWKGVQYVVYADGLDFLYTIPANMILEA